MYVEGWTHSRGGTYELSRSCLGILSLLGPTVTPQKYPRIFIIKIIIYSGYKLSQLGYFSGTDKLLNENVKCEMNM